MDLAEPEVEPLRAAAAGWRGPPRAPRPAPAPRLSAQGRGRGDAAHHRLLRRAEAGIEDQPLQLRDQVGLALRGEVDRALAAGLPQRGMVRHQRHLAMRQALGDRQAPALVEAVVEGEEAAAVQRLPARYRRRRAAGGPWPAAPPSSGAASAPPRPASRACRRRPGPAPPPPRAGAAASARRRRPAGGSCGIRRCRRTARRAPRAPVGRPRRPAAPPHPAGPGSRGSPARQQLLLQPEEIRPGAVGIGQHRIGMQADRGEPAGEFIDQRGGAMLRHQQRDAVVEEGDVAQPVPRLRLPHHPQVVRDPPGGPEVDQAAAGREAQGRGRPAAPPAPPPARRARPGRRPRCPPATGPARLAEQRLAAPPSRPRSPATKPAIDQARAPLPGPRG